MLEDDSITCPICGHSINSTEIERHVNTCLDGSIPPVHAVNQGAESLVHPLPPLPPSSHSTTSPHCLLCDKDLSNYDPARQNRHLKRCMKDVALSEEGWQQLLQPPSTTRPDNPGNDPSPRLLTNLSRIFQCPVCRFPWKGKGTIPARLAHMKACAKVHVLRVGEVLTLIDVAAQDPTFLQPPRCSDKRSSNPEPKPRSSKGKAPLRQQYISVKTDGLVGGKEVNSANDKDDDDDFQASTVRLLVQPPTASSRPVLKPSSELKEEEEDPDLVLALCLSRSLAEAEGEIPSPKRSRKPDSTVIGRHKRIKLDRRSEKLAFPPSTLLPPAQVIPMLITRAYEMLFGTAGDDPGLPPSGNENLPVTFSAHSLWHLASSDLSQVPSHSKLFYSSFMVDSGYGPSER